MAISISPYQNYYMPVSQGNMAAGRYESTGAAMPFSIGAAGSSAAEKAFGSPAVETTFGNPAAERAFGSPAVETTFGNPAAERAFGSPAVEMTFGNPAAERAFGSPAVEMTFGNPAAERAFGSSAAGKTFGNPVLEKIFGKDEQVEKAKPKGECQTCKNRKYVDGSDEGNVSFKTPGHIAPEASAGVVMAHEQEHVANAVRKGNEPGNKLVSVSVSLKTAICPECGRSYVAGGMTRTLIRYGSTPYDQNRKSADYAKLIGVNVDMKG